MNKNNNLVSVSQLAKIRGHSPQAIRKGIKSGRYKAFKIGSQWVVDIRETDKADARKVRNR